jgi:hypothetical protein
VPCDISRSRVDSRQQHVTRYAVAAIQSLHDVALDTFHNTALDTLHSPAPRSAMRPKWRVTQPPPQVWHFLQQHQDFLDIAELPALASLEAALFGRDSSGHDTIAAVAVPLLRLLLQDIYHVCTDEYIERDGNEGQQRKDLQGGAPIVDEDTWPFAASAAFAGAPLLHLRRSAVCLRLARCLTQRRCCSWLCRAAARCLTSARLLASPSHRTKEPAPSICELMECAAVRPGGGCGAPVAVAVARCTSSIAKHLGTSVMLMLGERAATRHAGNMHHLPTAAHLATQALRLVSTSPRPTPIPPSSPSTTGPASRAPWTPSSGSSTSLVPSRAPLRSAPPLRFCRKQRLAPRRRRCCTATLPLLLRRASGCAARGCGGRQRLHQMPHRYVPHSQRWATCRTIRCSHDIPPTQKHIETGR